MAASATFTYNGSDTITAHITGATVGHTITVYANDDDFQTNVSVVAPTASFSIPYGPVGVTTAGEKRNVFAWDTSDSDRVIGATIFAIDSGNSAEFSNAVTWHYDGVNTVTASWVTTPGSYGLETYEGDFNWYNEHHATSPGGSFTLQVVMTTTHGVPFTADVYSRSPAPYNIWGNRVFVPGVAGAGVPGNPGPAVAVTLDGVDVTNFCVAGNWTRRLNRPSTAQVRCQMEQVSAPVGSLLKIEALIGPTYEIVHHGRVLLVETDAGDDTGYTVYNSTDPMELWQWRPVRDDSCDFTKPDIIDAYTTGPQIMEAALQNTVYCGDGSQNDNEGPIFLDMGTFAGGGADLSGAPTDWPMTIAELASLLISTGELDLVITPTDPGGGVMGTIDGYNGDYGTDLSASIVFSYGMNAHNVRRLLWNQDMTTMCNKLWYFGGPRIATAADPAGDQHWCFNVQGDDPVLAFPPGGKLSPPASSTNNQLGVLRGASEAAYGVRMDIQIFDAYDNCGGVGAVGRDLFRRRWQQESWLRAQPREIIHITPTRETEIGTFDVGDLVGVECSPVVRGGFSGAQRVYQYTVSWDQDGVLELSELQTSADNEGL